MDVGYWILDAASGYWTASPKGRLFEAIGYRREAKGEGREAMGRLGDGAIRRWVLYYIIRMLGQKRTFGPRLCRC